MKAKQLFDKLIENWQVKAVCFVISIFLYAIYQNQSIDKKVFSVPLMLESKNGFVSIEPYPRTVAVSARGKAEELAQVRESDLRAYLDLSYVSRDGSYDFPVLITLSDSASVLNPLELKVTPEKVRLRVEEEITSYVDVVPLISGNPAYGYGIKNIIVSPDQIAITGPKTMIENCKSLQTLNVVTSNAKKSFTSKVKVEQKGLFIKHDDVEIAVTVEIEESQGSKQFTKIPVNIVNVAPNLEVTAMTKEVTFTLEGSLVSLEKFTPDPTFVTADASKIQETGTVYLELSYFVPRAFKLSEGYTKSIPVTFAKKEVEEAAEEVTEDEETELFLETESEQTESKSEEKPAAEESKTETKKRRGWW